MKGKAVVDDSSTETITVTIVLAKEESVELSFRSDQTVRDIRNAIDERTPDNNRDYYLQTMDADCRDLNATVGKILKGDSKSLYQIFPDL